MKKFLLSAAICTTLFTTSAFAFSDVPEKFWAYDAIKFMEERNVVSGFAEDGTFRPSDSATREQTATILGNFFGLELKNKAKIYDDVNSSDWSYKYVNIASQYLYDENAKSFRPQELATRIEIAEAVVRILGLDLEEPNLGLIENFKDYNEFSEKDRNTIALVVENGIMKGYDDGTFQPNGKITRAEICSLLYNAFGGRDELLSKNDDKIALTVNGENVSVKEFNLYFNVQKKLFELLFKTSDIWTQEVQNTVLYSYCKDATREEIAKIKIVMQKAEELGIKLDKSAEEKLKEQSTSKESEALCQYYGITNDELLKILEESATNELVAKYMYDKIDHTNHTHRDINAPKEKFSYDIRHILILTADRTEAEKEMAKERAENIFVRVNNGEDFAKLANEYSEDPGSNKNGGLYENVKLGDFVSEIEEVAVNGEVGEIYQNLVKTDYGYHIVKVEGKRTEKVQLTEEEKLTIITADFEEIVTKWLEEANVVDNKEVFERI